MEFLIIALLTFGAYRVWKRETFFGAKRQWAKLLIYLPVSGIASIFFLIEAIFHKSKDASATKKDSPKSKQ